MTQTKFDSQGLLRQTAMLDVCVCVCRALFSASPWGRRPLQVVHGLLRVGIPYDDLTVRSLVSSQMLHAIPGSKVGSRPPEAKNL